MAERRASSPNLLTALVRHPDLLGEAPAYDAVSRRLVWVDMIAGAVHEVTVRDDHWSSGRTWDVGPFVSGAIPRTSGGLLVARRNDFATLGEDGEIEVVARFDVPHGGRLNDIKCDRSGRLFAGWLSEALTEPGGVVRLDPDRTITTVIDGITLPNGIDWNPDDTTLYLVDSVARTIDAFEFDANTGEVGESRTLITIERGVGGPNGIAVDDDGNLWVAVTYGGEVRRYSPAGEFLDTISLPARRPTSCAFAGPRGNDLMITTSSAPVPGHVPRSVGVTEARIRLADEDDAGGTLFVYRVQVSGPPASPYAG